LAKEPKMAGFMKYPEGWGNLLAPLKYPSFCKSERAFLHH
jgi:hypothetical protein